MIARFLDWLGSLKSDNAKLNDEMTTLRYERGIAWRYRPLIADMARKAKVKLPDGFFDPGLSEAA